MRYVYTIPLARIVVPEKLSFMISIVTLWSTSGWWCGAGNVVCAMYNSKGCDGDRMIGVGDGVRGLDLTCLA